MTAAHEIHAEFRSAPGKFTLEAVFTVPATGITMLFGPSGCDKTTVLRELGFARGQNVFAQVKSVAMGRADAPE